MENVNGCGRVGGGVRLDGYAQDERRDDTGADAQMNLDRVRGDNTRRIHLLLEVKRDGWEDCLWVCGTQKKSERQCKKQQDLQRQMKDESWCCSDGSEGVSRY